MNKVWLCGRLGKSPELRQTESGKSVANFSLATQEYKDNTEWHNLVVWGTQADNLAKYITKGDMINVVGRLQTRSYESDNGTKYITEIVCENIEYLTTKSDKQEPKKEEEKPFDPSGEDLPW